MPPSVDARRPVAVDCRSETAPYCGPSPDDFEVTKPRGQPRFVSSCEGVYGKIGRLMPLQYIDLSTHHGHRDDHGFACGAEFNVKIRRRINIPDFVREALPQHIIDDLWREEAGQARDSLREALTRRYKWIGALTFVGRGPGWLAVQDTGCRPRNWDAIGKVVEQYLQHFIKSMENPGFWRAMKGVAPKKSPADIKRDIDEVLARKPSSRGDRSHASTGIQLDPGEWWDSLSRSDRQTVAEGSLAGSAYEDTVSWLPSRTWKTIRPDTIREVLWKGLSRTYPIRRASRIRA